MHITKRIIPGLQNYRVICGVDEAGRGPLAGSVFAACVILDQDHDIEFVSMERLLEEYGGIQRHTVNLAMLKG